MHLIQLIPTFNKCSLCPNTVLGTEKPKGLTQTDALLLQSCLSVDQTAVRKTFSNINMHWIKQTVDGEMQKRGTEQEEVRGTGTEDAPVLIE